MLTVVIVDDEKRIVEMIRQLMDWRELGFEVIDVAYNGPDAFALVEEKRPDVVIADVRMPGYDGIELIRRCHDAEHFPSFIIVSGYRFFEYAHNALRYGVEHYLLKPLEKQELARSLEMIKEKRGAEKERKAHDKSAEKWIDEGRELKRSFVLNCIDAPPLSISLEEANREYKTSFKEGENIVYTALYIRLFSTTGARMNLEPILDRVLQNFHGTLEGVCDGHAEAPYNSGVVSILSCDRRRLSQIGEKLSRMHSEIRRRTEMFGHFDVVMGLGIETGDFSRIPQAVSTAMTAVMYSLDIKTSSVIRYGDFSYWRTPVTKFFTPEVERLFLEAVVSDEAEGIKKYYNGCLARINSVQRRCPSMIYDFVLMIRDCIVKYIDDSQLDRTELDIKLTRLAEALDHRCTAAELTEGVLLIVLNISSIISKQRYLEYSRPVRQARKYIEAHYMEPVTLDCLAKIVHLSSSYLSTVFKDETGLGFSEYLINCRISAAKELLRNTDLSLAQISEKIGYLDPKHFGKLFKRVTGIKPTDFRKLYS